jgi:hypothetical protein
MGEIKENTMENVLFDLDKYLFALIQGSGFVMLTGFGVLKILAIEAGWATGNKIINLFLGLVKRHKG